MLIVASRGLTGGTNFNFNYLFVITGDIVPYYGNLDSADVLLSLGHSQLERLLAFPHQLSYGQLCTSHA